MKIILLFDTEMLENRYRIYELSDELDKVLCENREEIDITFCHPDMGEIFEARPHNK